MSREFLYCLYFFWCYHVFMRKLPVKRGRGRPRLPKAERIRKPLNMRVNQAFYVAAAAYRTKKNLNTLSAAVRAAAEQTLRAEGLLK